MTSEQTRRPWQRQEDESAGDHQAFMTYARMDPLRRSVRKAAGIVGIGKSTALKMSKRHAWVVRVVAWDAHVERLQASAIEGEKRRQSVLEARTLTKLLALAELDVDRLTAMFAKRKKFIISARDLTALLTAGVNLSRVGRGESEHRVEIAEADSAREQIRRTLDRYAKGEGRSPDGD